MNIYTAASAEEGESSPSRRVTQPCEGNPGEARTAFPGWGSGEALRSGERARERAAGRVCGADPARPRLLFAGVPSGRGLMEVLMRHLEGLGQWKLLQTDSTHAVFEQWQELQPDVIVTLWSSEPELQAWVAEIRALRKGAVPVIVAGGPPGQGGGPCQPVRGVLCLPVPLKWRTFLLCLEEHWRVLQRRSL